MTKAEMINEVESLIGKHGSDVAMVINMSGGKDSVRMMGYLRETFPGVKMYAVMADTGFEHVKPVSAEEFARERCAAYGLELHVVSAVWGDRRKLNGEWVKNPKVGTRKSYLDMVEQRGMFPSTQYRQCTSDLKRNPIAVFLRSLPESVIINCTGIRAAESPARAKQTPWKRNETLCTKNGSRTVYDWMPIFAESLEDVLQWHTATGTALHPVYVWAGGHLKRLSCRICIFSTNADIHAIYKHDREAFDLVANLEQKMGFTMKSGQSLFQIIGQDVAADDAQYGSEEAEIACAA